MRTSRLSKDTSKIAQTLAPQRRQTRNSLAASALRNFAYSETSSIKTESSIVKSELDDDDSSSLSSANTEDIEDLLEPPAKRRRRNVETPPTSIGSGRRVKKEEPTIKAEAKTTIKAEEEEARPKTSKPRRQPVRKIKREDGSVDVQPPSNWETMYEIVKKMRAANPTAPVDTMGCAELHWKSSPLKDQRFQTLIALMLSSQTKDTVTAPAMHRLHTELGEQEESPSLLVKKEEMKPSLSQLIKAEEEEDDIDGIKPHAELKPSLNSLIKKEENDDTDGLEAPAEKKSTLTLKNILAVSPERLNELIRTVGFHNNKTKYIKQVALILRDQYDGDIPSTVDGLMKLPGVGPKMSYLCMSAAWGKHEGIGVDVHVHRITNMWGWHTTKNPEETRMALQSWLPKDKWHEINKLLVGLGQTACLPVARRCGECDLAGTGLCKSETRGILARTKKEKEEEEEEAKVKIERV